MFFRKTIRVLREMYLCGGMEISTKYDDIPRSDSSICAWTLIQPDGDIINKISENALSQPETWNRHLANVEKKIDILRRFRRILKWVSVSSIPVLLSTAYAAWNTHENIYRLVVISAMGSVPGIISLFVRPIAGCMLRWYIKRKLAKL